MVGMAVVGAGAWGKNHIRVFSELPDVRLKYVCDSDRSKLQSIQKTYPQTKMVETMKPILEDSEVRGSSLPPPQHRITPSPKKR